MRMSAGIDMIRCFRPQFFKDGAWGMLGAAVVQTVESCYIKWFEDKCYNDLTQPPRVVERKWERYVLDRIEDTQEACDKLVNGTFVGQHLDKMVRRVNDAARRRRAEAYAKSDCKHSVLAS